MWPHDSTIRYVQTELPIHALHWREAILDVAQKAGISAIPVAHCPLLVPISNVKVWGVMVPLDSLHFPGLEYNLPKWVRQDHMG